ncbi:MAG TPA: sigma-70 family RNA polymerase sigma factor [Haliangiales bacterium]|nr:sigma-70 family RNA polymerase sigma factor [Haliangiales bacterium]
MSPEEDDEARLVARANAGDAGALAALYRAHRGWVAALALRFTGNQADALDVLQETFLYLFRRLPLALTTSLRGFLYPVVKHQSISVVRRRRPEVAVDDASLPWHGAADAGDFTRLVAALPAEQREVVRLRFGLDLSLDEIAAALGVPLGTVKSRLHNALKTLRSQIA